MEKGWKSRHWDSVGGAQRAMLGKCSSRTGMVDSGCTWLQMKSLVPLPIWGTVLVSLLSQTPVLFRVRRNSRKDVYQPPLATDIEKMKTTHLKEQKMFALIREILGRQPRLPMTGSQHRLEQTLCNLSQPHTEPWIYFPRYQLTPASPQHNHSVALMALRIKSKLPTVASPTLGHLSQPPVP